MSNVQKSTVGDFTFERQPNGNVRLSNPSHGCSITIDAGIWASTVLTMMAFNERPNDWHRFMEHHLGMRDILSLGHPFPQHAGAEQLAKAFHEAYERLAPAYGYETREASRKPWENVPEQNRKLMVAVCSELLTAFGPKAVQ